MAEKQGSARLDRASSPDVRGREESATPVGLKPDPTGPEHGDDSANSGTSAEGRDRPPSSRGRDPKSPWLGGG